MAKIRPLAPELAEVAHTKLREIDDRIVEEIQALRTYLEAQDHIKARTDDQFLIAFLRFCRYNRDEAFRRIEYYYTYKTVQRDLMKSRQIDQRIYDILRTGIFATLPKPAGAGGPRIHVTRMGRIDTSLYTIQDMFRFHAFRSEIEINTDDNWIISGVLEVIDFGKIPYSLLRQFDAGLFKKMAAFLEYGIPTELKATHIVNASIEAQLILNLVRLAMKQKELLHIHSSLDSLQKAIGIEYLPEDYGGTNGTIDMAVTNFEKTLGEFETYFNEEDQYVVDEKLKKDKTPTGTANTTPSKSGKCIEESFRKLDID